MKQSSLSTKRLLSFIMAIVMVLSMLPATAFAADTDTTVYLKPNSNWLQANARFAIYCFGNGETWVDMSDADGDGYYEGVVPAGYPSVIFCRMNPSTTANNWNNKWNQTGDLTLPTNGNNCYTVAEGAWDKGSGSWSSYTPTEEEEPEETEPVVVAYLAGSMNSWDTTSTPIYSDQGATITLNAGTYEFKIVCDGAWYGNNGTIADTTTATSDIGWEMSTSAGNCKLNASGGDYTFTFNKDTKYLVIDYKPGESGEDPAPPVEATYIIAGTANLCGTAWDVANAANKMYLNSEGLYEKTYESVTIGTHSFKVTDGSWDSSWGGDGENGNYDFTLTAISNVTITFNADNKKITVTTEATGEEPEPVESVNNVTIHYRNTGMWSEVHAYGWLAGTDTTVNGGWPGNKLTEDSDHPNWYTVTLNDLNAEGGIGILFNNGGDSGKTGDIMITADDEYWYDGQLLTEAPDTWADGTVKTVPYSVTMHFADTKNWRSVSLYTWTDFGAPTGSWPGTACELDINDFYTMSFTYEAPEGQGLSFIFNNGGDSGKTVDLKLDNSAFTEVNGVYTAEKWVVPTTANDDGIFYADIGSTREAIAISPVVNGYDVTFQYKDPNASSVSVAGTLTNWKSNAMIRNDYGVWSVTLKSGFGVNRYKFIVDGDWVMDPLNDWVYTEADGTQNSTFLISNPKADENTIQIKVHYDASPEWNVCAWGAEGLEPQYNFSNGVAKIKLDGRTNQYVAFKVRKSLPGNDWAEQSGEIRINLSTIISGTIDVWVGDNFSVSQTLVGDVVYGNKIKSAELDYDDNTITIKTVKAVNNAETAFAIYKDGEPADIIDTITSSGNSYTLTLKETLDLVNLHTYKIAFLEDSNEAYQGGIHTIGINTVYASDKFAEEFTYDGELGALWSAQSTTFRVWAPTAAAVSVKLYTSGTEGTDDLIEAVPMSSGENGTWFTTVDGDLNGTYYTYAVTVDGKTVEAVDPYARTTGVNGKRGMVIDLDSTDPAGWADDQNPNPITKYSDAIIYELHVRDFSIDDSSGVSEANRGKYLAFTEEGTTTANGVTTGIDYLDELGITHLHLLPVYDYGSVDETKCDAFNWGYDPVNYNAPEGSYSTDPYNGAVRVNEFKQMVMALHEADISVIMDVVYNHVYDAGKFCMNQIVPKYFSRVNADGSYSNGSGCGNDTASEREMVRKYIVESVLYWCEEYHIDGFRFDLVGLLDATTINQIVDEVHKIRPDVIFYGEGWSMGTAVEPGNGMATQANSAETPNFAYFSDTFRDEVGACKNFDNTVSLGFVSGKTGIEENVANNFMARPWWSKNPQQIVQYVSCHDNYTMVDKLVIALGKSEIDDKVIKMNNLAAAIYMTSQGIPFIHAGEEFLREKLEEDGGRCENSYNASDFVNHIEWSNLEKETYAANSDYYKGLIEFRKAHDSLRLETTAEITENVKYTWVANEVVMFTINAENAGDVSDSIVAIFNATNSSKTVNLPEGSWSICINGTQAGTDVIETVRGSVSVDGISAMVLVQGETAPEHAHDWKDGVCNDCGETCTHSFTDGLCTICAMVCGHEMHWQNGLCSNCFAEVEHVYSENGLCSCGKSLCDHVSHNVSGLCDACGLAVGHTIGEDGICTICTYNQNLTANLAGSMNGWSTTDTTMYSVGGSKVAVTTHLTAGTYEFKIVYNGSWYGNSGTINGATDTGWVMDSSDNCKLTASYDGDYTFVYDTAENKLEVYNKFTGSLYLRGSFNNWETTTAMDYVGSNTYTASVTLEAGSYEFKVGNADWSFGQPAGNISITLDRKSELTVTAKYNGDGTWTVSYETKLCYVAENTATGTGYLTVAEALAEAKAGERVILLTDCSESRVLVTPGVTLDLNGWTLTADYVVGFNTSAICDSSNNAENSYVAKGLLVVKPDNMVLYEDNGAVPVYNPEKGGYIFVDFLFQSKVVQGDGVYTVNLLVTSRTMEVIDLLKDGAASNDIQIAVRLNWDNETGTAYQDFVFNETTVQNVMQSNGGTYGSFGRMFYLNVTGLEELENVTATAMVISGSNAVDSGNTLNVK